MDVMDTLLHRPNAEAHFQAPFDSAQSRSSTQATEVSLHLMGPCIGVCVCVRACARVGVCHKSWTPLSSPWMLAL